MSITCSFYLTLKRKRFPAALLVLEVTFGISFKRPSSQHYEQTALKGICCIGWISCDTRVTNRFRMGKQEQVMTEQPEGHQPVINKL